MRIAKQIIAVLLLGCGSLYSLYSAVELYKAGEGYGATYLLILAALAGIAVVTVSDERF